MNSFQKQMGMAILIAFSAIALVIVLTQFVGSHLKGSADKILQQKIDLAFRIQATDQLTSLKADSDKARPFFATLNGILPLKDDLINFGQSLIQLGKNNKIDLGFTFGGEILPKGGLPGSISFSINGNGSYENFQKFLKDIESSSYFVKLNSTDLVRQAGANTFSIIAEGQVFYQ